MQGSCGVLLTETKQGNNAETCRNHALIKTNSKPVPSDAVVLWSKQFTPKVMAATPSGSNCNQRNQRPRPTQCPSERRLPVPGWKSPWQKLATDNMLQQCRHTAEFDFAQESCKLDNNATLLGLQEAPEDARFLRMPPPSQGTTKDERNCRLVKSLESRQQQHSTVILWTKLPS